MTIEDDEGNDITRAIVGETEAPCPHCSQMTTVPGRPPIEQAFDVLQRVALISRDYSNAGRPYFDSVRDVGRYVGVENYEESHKWYDHEDHMNLLSAEFPDWTFVLNGEGEEQGDVWRKRFCNGEMTESKKARLVFD